MVLPMYPRDIRHKSYNFHHSANALYQLEQQQEA